MQGSNKQQGAKAPINNGGNMVTVHDKTGRIIYTVDRPPKKQNNNLLTTLKWIGSGFIIYMPFILWAVIEILR